LRRDGLLWIFLLGYKIVAVTFYFTYGVQQVAWETFSLASEPKLLKVHWTIYDVMNNN